MEPAVKPAASTSNSGTIAVFATEATFQGELFDSVVSRHASNTEVIATACPDWVDLVEQGLFTGPVVEKAVAGPVRDAIAAGADSLVLGCTHFSFLAEAIHAVAGDIVSVIDPAPAVAAQTRRVAHQSGGRGRLKLAASGDLDQFARLAGQTGIGQAGNSVLPFPA
jgi:glutamate racemase